MTFENHEGDLYCACCECVVTLDEYRRKVPTCDDCYAEMEVDALMSDLAEFERAA